MLGTRSAAPFRGAIIQQSPNGLFAWHHDEGIELRGPTGGVKITNAGSEIGARTGVSHQRHGHGALGDKILQLNVAQPWNSERTGAKYRRRLSGRSQGTPNTGLGHATPRRESNGQTQEPRQIP